MGNIPSRNFRQRHSRRGCQRSCRIISKFLNLLPYSSFYSEYESPTYLQLARLRQATWAMIVKKSLVARLFVLIGLKSESFGSRLLSPNAKTEIVHIEARELLEVKLIP